MPLYEYICRSCGHQFEALVRDANIPHCPTCNGQELERQLSLFAVDSEGTRHASLSKAREANKKVLRDKAVAEREYEQHHHH